MNLFRAQHIKQKSETSPSFINPDAFQNQVGCLSIDTQRTLPALLYGQLFPNNFAIFVWLKFGDRLVDIAKYMVTIILRTSILSDMQNVWTYIIVAITVVAILLMGLWLSRDKTSER